MNPGEFLGAFMRTLLGSLAVVLSLAVLPAAAADKPNIILLMCDDLGWGDVGFNGNKVIRTPHLDAMSKAGLRFTRFYAQAPVCSPTRGSCLTGRHPYRYGVYSANVGHMKAQEHTLAELLRAQGYATGHFGKWHLGTLTKTVRDSNRGGPRGIKHFSPPWSNGFEVCFSTEAKVPTWDPMLKPKQGASNKGWPAIEKESEAIPYRTHYWNEAGEMVKDNLRGDDSRVIMDRVVPFVEKSAKAGQPFFAVVWLHTPHLPVVAGTRYREMYPGHDLYAQNYFGCITAMDEQVGRLRQTQDLKVAQDTMLWFCSDNGPEGRKGRAPGSAGPFRGRKRDLYEGGIRVPALLEWPARVEGGSVTDFPAVTSDYLPTILEVLGVKRLDARPIDGISLVPVIAGKLKERPRPIGFQSRQQRALSDNHYKLITTDAGKSYQLYDLLADPGEKEDVSAKHTEVVERMRQQLQAWRASCARSDEGKDYP
jgi:arylsulfatase A-like enzyme